MTLTSWNLTLTHVFQKPAINNHNASGQLVDRPTSRQCHTFQYHIVCYILIHSNFFPQWYPQMLLDFKFCYVGELARQQVGCWCRHLNPTVWCTIMATLCHTNKKLEAAHHKFQRRLLAITWRDKVKNEYIRKKTGSRKLEDIIKEDGSDGLDTYWEWTTPEQLVRQRTGNWEVTRENQDDQGRTG